MLALLHGSQHLCKSQLEWKNLEQISSPREVSTEVEVSLVPPILVRHDRNVPHLSHHAGAHLPLHLDATSVLILFCL